jgi:N-acetylmuramoyl-L-alanine amidase CwlA
MNTSGDIYDSYQRNAQLVADILLRNNLDPTRVKQHNTFDGKNCPQVIRAGNYWDQFMKMVEINYILGKDYSDAKISMVSDNPDIVAHNGRVINYPSVATTVGYTITVTIGSTTKSIKLYSVVPGTTSWEKWDGTYPSSLIWNNGNFVVNK